MYDRQKSIPIVPVPVPVPFFSVLKILNRNTEAGGRENVGGSV
jgi:hypothetical protein